jgi:hypothetical protein
MTNLSERLHKPEFSNVYPYSLNPRIYKKRMDTRAFEIPEQERNHEAPHFLENGEGQPDGRIDGFAHYFVCRV